MEKPEVTDESDLTKMSESEVGVVAPLDQPQEPGSNRTGTTEFIDDHLTNRLKATASKPKETEQALPPRL